MIQFNIYDRADEDHGFMGSVKVKPTLVHDHAVDQWYKYVHLSPPLRALTLLEGLVRTKTSPILLVKSTSKSLLNNTR
jgi:hypothetical protein